MNVVAFISTVTFTNGSPLSGLAAKLRFQHTPTASHFLSKERGSVGVLLETVRQDSPFVGHRPAPPAPSAISPITRTPTWMHASSTRKAG